ncbi:MAG TPA: hypothetical protein VFB55_11310 [Verrucomicrobiae bacterium]|nr:hypothetical protein [Verrucomicrobiae bacterium]
MPLPFLQRHSDAPGAVFDSQPADELDEKLFIYSRFWIFRNLGIAIAGKAEANFNFNQFTILWQKF